MTRVDAMLIALAFFGAAVAVLALTLWIVVFRRFRGKGVRDERAAQRREERAEMRRNRP